MDEFVDGALDVLRVVAPGIATALGGPLAGLAVSAVANAFGRPGGCPKELSDAILAAGPDGLLKLKQADQAFAAQMRALDIQADTVAAGDRSSARARQIGMHDQTPAFLAYALTAGFFSLIGVMVYHPLPEANAQLINILLGSLGTAWVSAMQYFFGSSSGSRGKDAALADSVPASTFSTVTSQIKSNISSQIQSILPRKSQPQPGADPARGSESSGRDSTSGG